jgi:hypothetical protein
MPTPTDLTPTPATELAKLHSSGVPVGIKDVTPTRGIRTARAHPGGWAFQTPSYPPRLANLSRLPSVPGSAIETIA